MNNVLPTLNSSANSFKSLAQNEALVTTKELAAVLNVDVSTIQKTIKKLQATSDVLPKFGKGQTPKFNEEQATLIKQEIQKHHNLANRQIDSVSTQIEENETIAKAMAILNRRNEELLSVINSQKVQINELTPDAESWRAFAEKDGTFCVTKVASCLNIQPKVIFNYLEVKGFITHSSGRWMGTVLGTSVRGYVSNEIVTGEKFSTIQMRLTAKGMQKIAELFGKNPVCIEETSDKWIEEKYQRDWRAE